MGFSTTEQANRELVEQLLVWMRDDRGCRPASVYDYASRLERFLDFAGPLLLNNVKVDVLRAWVNRPKGGRAHGTIGKPATRAKDVAVLRSLFNYLHASELVERNPTVLLVAPKVHNRNPKPIPEDVWMKLWNSSALTDEGRAVLGLGFFIGLRRQEIVRLSPAHFSVAPRMIVGFIRKGGGDDVTEYGAIVDVFADLMPHLIGNPQSFLGPLHELVERRAGKARLLDWRERQKPVRLQHREALSRRSRLGSRVDEQPAGDVARKKRAPPQRLHPAPAPSLGCHLPEAGGPGGLDDRRSPQPLQRQHHEAIHEGCRRRRGCLASTAAGAAVGAGGCVDGEVQPPWLTQT